MMTEILYLYFIQKKAPSKSAHIAFANAVRAMTHSERAAEILSIDVIDQSLDHWEARIQGPVDTPYENGVFVLNINIAKIDRTETYPIAPPKITFKTKVFHPNINSRGEICLSILDDKYSPVFCLESILISIVSLLSHPNADDCLVPEAGFLYKTNRTEFDRIAREWTRQYAMVAGDPRKAQENLNDVSSL
jgi:ubiquitin-conjugating enzyme E2 D/E